VPASQKNQVLSKNEVGRAFRDKIPGIYQIFGDSRDIGTYARLKGKAVDLAFIDGNHSFDAVVRDTRNVLKFTKKRSIIFWHDFKDSDADGIIEVKQALDSLCYSERLKIFHIHKTWLAFTII
ncbi:MAG: class I SAM-dependent methyltransferase, partial [Candidatus Omnitrophota bacterium]|nr:class I SAM-dependent methyltransferase [Candidatus Omnitrophota bacterium]